MTSPRIPILALFSLLSTGSGAFPLWLDSPVRSNPFDPKSTFFVTTLPTLGPVATATITQTPPNTSTATPTRTASPTPTPSATPVLDVDDPTDNSNGGANSVSSYPYSVAYHYVGYSSDGFDYYAIPVVSGNSYSVSAVITSGSGTITVENRGQSDSATLGSNASTSTATYNFTSSGITGTVFFRVSATNGVGYTININDTTGSTPTYTFTPQPTFTHSPENTFTHTETTAPSFTATPTVDPATPTDTPTPGTACFTIPGSPPVLTQPLYEGTGTNQLGADGGDAGGWTNPPPSSMTQSAVSPSPGGPAYLVLYFDWTAGGGWWGGGGYNWASWWNPAKQYDIASFDTLEFWVRGDVGGETALSVSIPCATGTSNTIVFTNSFTAATSLTTTWEYVKIPLCTFDWTGADTTKAWEIDFSGGHAEFGAVTFYVADIKFAKY